MNESTHVASIQLAEVKDRRPEKAVVKAFRFEDQCWANEAVSWILAAQLGITVAPRAAVLVGDVSEVLAHHGPELNDAVRYWSGAFVLWCTSAIEPTQSLQTVYPHPWQTTGAGSKDVQQIGAFDGWVGNADRIDTNALWWTSKGSLVAIDHEKAIFNQAWTASAPEHCDETVGIYKRLVPTVIIDQLLLASTSKTPPLRRKANQALSAMRLLSEEKHPQALGECNLTLANLVQDDFGSVAWRNILSFLEHRLDQASLSKRYSRI